MKVALFPGHVGKDSGAVDPDDNDSIYTVESDLTKIITNEVSKLLNQFYFENVVCSGSWEERIIKSSGCDFGVSIHADVSYKNVFGHHVIYFPKSKKGEIFAWAMEHNLLYNKRCRFPHAENLKILRDTKFPCILIEVGFISNEKEEVFLNDSENQKLIARDIVKGIFSIKHIIQEDLCSSKKE